MKYKSFTDFLHEFLDADGFQRNGKMYWYREARKAVIVVNLQKSSFGPGVYLNYGLSFSSKKKPKDFDCEVFGRNPGLSSKKYFEFQKCINEVNSVCEDRSAQDFVRNTIRMQIECLSEWQDLVKLKRRLLNDDEVLEMIVDRVKLDL